MQTINISDEVFQRLRDFIVDPFEDTPEVVLTRLIEIAGKAKNRWTPWSEGSDVAPMGGPLRRGRMARPAQDAGEESSETMVVL